MARLVLTGASGYVAGHVAARAASRGLEVLGVVRSEAGAAVVAGRGARPVVVPELRPEPLRAAFAGARAVVHLAQIGDEAGGQSFEAVNVGGTRAVAEAAVAAGVARVAFLSGLGVARYGLSRRCTNGYFLSKLRAEVELYRSGLEVAVFRPSYILGPGDGFVGAALRELEAGSLEIPGDGSYRMQPVAARDAAAAVVEAAVAESPERTRVFDLVGPEPVAYRALLERLWARCGARGRSLELRFREVSMEEAERRAAAGGFHGMGRDSLDCLLCDEVSDPRPLAELLGRGLTPLDETLDLALEAALRAARDAQ